MFRHLHVVQMPSEVFFFLEPEQSLLSALWLFSTLISLHVIVEGDFQESIYIHSYKFLILKSSLTLGHAIKYLPSHGLLLVFHDELHMAHLKLPRLVF